MRRNQLFVLVGMLTLLGAAGLAIVFVAVVARILSTGWAVLAGFAVGLALVAAALAVSASARLVRGFRQDLRSALSREVKALTAAQPKAIERVLEARLAAQEKTVRRVFEVRLEQEARRTRAVVDGVYSQLEALEALYRLLEPEHPLPPLRRWAVSPDLAVHLVGLVFDGSARTVLETGSGSSTVLLALALERVDAGRVVALEHDPQYAAATRRMLRDFGLQHRAAVVDAPLVDVTLDGETFRWYDIGGVDLPDAVDLLVVDGPPEATGHHARYPALPLLRPALRTGAIVILDDGDRAGEQEVVQRWAELSGVGRPQTLNVERKAMQLAVSPADPGVPGADEERPSRER